MLYSDPSLFGGGSPGSRVGGFRVDQELEVGRCFCDGSGVLFVVDEWV